MPRPNCPHSRGVLYSVPGPLFGRMERDRGEPTPVPAPSVAPVLLPTHWSKQPNLPMCRHVNPIPAPSNPSIQEALCLLRQEQHILTEILEAIHALTAAMRAKNK